MICFICLPTISLTSSPITLPLAHSVPSTPASFAVPQTYQMHSHFKPFTFAVPYTQNTLPDICTDALSSFRFLVNCPLLTEALTIPYKTAPPSLCPLTHALFFFTAPLIYILNVHFKYRHIYLFCLPSLRGKLPKNRDFVLFTAGLAGHRTGPKV